MGAHESGLISEDPVGTPNNLMPYVAKVASGELPYLNIFGDDFETKDGTGERDYIHVMDIANGHLASLESLKNHNGLEIVNLGTGKSHSGLDLVLAFEKVSDRIIKRVITQRRSGDMAIYYADVNKAKILLNWEARSTLSEMCSSVWNIYKDAARSESHFSKLYRP